MADEIIVHDTGSADHSRDIARRAGAVVLAGCWEDHFGAARTVALGASTGEWVLSIDADEVFIGDGEQLRAWLRAVVVGVDAELVAIDNLLDDGTGYSYRSTSCRLFRRSLARWQGRIHERVVALDGTDLVLGPSPAPARIEHHGYLRDLMRQRGKLDRNIRLARAALTEADLGPDRVVLRSNLGRSLKAAGALDEAVTELVAAADEAPGLAVGRAGLHFATSCLLGLGRLDDAADLLARYRHSGGRPGIAQLLEGQLRLQRGDGAGALACFESIAGLVDDEGRQLAAGVLPLHRGLALSLLGRWDAAADTLAVAVVDRGAVCGNLSLLWDAWARAGRPVADLVEKLCGRVRQSVFAELARLPVATADSLSAGLWDFLGPDGRLLAALAALWPRLDLAGALAWSLRLNVTGHDGSVPLLSLARDCGTPGRLRVRAGALVAGAGDLRGVDAVLDAAPDVAPGELAGALADLGDLFPEMLPTFIGASATTAARCLQLADALHRLGANEQASALARTALSLDPDPSTTQSALAWLAGASI